MEQIRPVERERYGRKELVILVRGANIMNGRFRNFSGEKLSGPYDRLGKRYFNIQFTNPDAIDYLRNGDFPIDVKTFDDGSEVGYMQVNVKPEGPYPCTIKVQIGNEEASVLMPEDYAVLDGLKRGTEYSDTLITSANLTLRFYKYDPIKKPSCQLEEGIFTLQPMSYWDSQFAEEEFPHE